MSKFKNPEYQRLWKLNNKEKSVQYNEKYRLNNPEKIKERQKNYRDKVKAKKLLDKEQKGLLTTSEVAKMINCSRSQVTTLIYKGLLAYERTGFSYFILKTEVERYIKSKGEKRNTTLIVKPVKTKVIAVKKPVSKVIKQPVKKAPEISESEKKKVYKLFPISPKATGLEKTYFKKQG